MRGEPGRGAPVQRRDVVGQLPAQLGAQELGEQRVVAMPGAALVERRREHAAVLQSRQHRVAVARPGQRVGELGAQGLDDRRAQQEVAQLGWLAGQHLADQVVADGRVGAGEPLDEGARVGMVLQRHRRQAQRCRPALGAPPQRGQVLGRQHDAERGEQRSGLVQREVQIVRADLGQAAVEAQAAEADRRVGPRDDDEPQGRRREAHEPFEISCTASMTSWKSSSTRTTGCGTPSSASASAARHQAHAHGLARTDRQRRDRIVARRRAEGREDPAPEAAAIGVVGVEREPGDGSRRTARGDPRAQQRALAGTGRSGHQGHRPLHAGVEAVEQSRAQRRRPSALGGPRASSPGATRRPFA